MNEETIIEKRPGIDFHNSVYLSSDNISLEMLNHLKEHKSMFSTKNNNFVVDHNSNCFFTSV